MRNITTITDLLTYDNLINFLEYKKISQNISASEITAIETYINNKSYLPILRMISDGIFPDSPSRKSIISKEDSTKKRTVYSFADDISITLKFIAYNLYQYDYLFYPNCYSFRKKYGVTNAIYRITHTPELKQQFCLKVDIHNYFNSIDINLLLDKLAIVNKYDSELFNIFKNILTEKKTDYCGTLIEENRGAMAGIPVSPFFANIYMCSIDEYFYSHHIEYYRYSDDIILFSSSMDELNEYRNILYTMISELRLTINHEKEYIREPGQTWEFLGFSYLSGEIDLSDNSIKKLKSKIKRKAHALRRWQIKKNLSPDKAAIGFIRAINRKLYGKASDNLFDNSEFTWCRWFFPNITTTKSLKVLDAYIQQYIRFIITGRHYKGNYRIPYSQLKEWGYRNLVHEYYIYKNSRK